MKTLAGSMGAGVQRFHSLRRVVRDLPASVAFYRQGLGFRVISDIGPTATAPGIVVLALGTERIELVAAHAGVRWPAPADGPNARFQHFSVVASDIERAYGQLQSVAPASISRGGPQQLPAASGGVRAFKFRDPDGHPLELLEFPPGTGDRRWQAARAQHPNDATLGIDHAAISVTDVERSIAFYQRLGFKVGARQRNTGAEQARLDGLDQSEVEVVALLPAGASGPHLELLAYQIPQPIGARAGKPGSGAQVTQDRLVWQIIGASHPAAPVSVASAVEATVQQPAPEAAPAAPFPMLLADPDGHLHEFVPAAAASHPEAPRHA